jgi:hypothetical protein
MKTERTKNKSFKNKRCKVFNPLVLFLKKWIFEKIQTNYENYLIINIS